jgi:CO/xanthine dehydrogenase FAD-binding subunit
VKPVAFQYHRAASVAEACALLAEDPGALLIAGGQTLMPMLAMRLARPSRVIDIMRIPDLDGIDVSEADVTIGAGTRQMVVEHSRAVAEELPLLARAMPWVGHPPTRRRGTVGGSIANADPAAEIGLCGVALGAEVLLEGGPDGAQAMSLADFFLGPMTTAIPAGAMVTAVRFPHRRDRRRTGVSFREVARRHGDYALAAAAAELTLDADGRCREIRLAVGGATTVPTALALTGLIGTTLEAGMVREAVSAALQGLEMMQDHNASAAYRRRAALALATEAVAEARENAA